MLLQLLARVRHTSIMAYPTKLLAQDEQLVLDLHPHWKSLLRPVLVLVVTLGVGSYAVARLPGGSHQGTWRLVVAALAVLVLLAFSLRPFLAWVTTHFVITDRRVLVRSGILARSGRDVPLSRINDITFSHSFLERLLGCGTLVVESAGERGQVTLTDVPRVESVQRQLYDLVESTDDRRRGLDAD